MVKRHLRAESREAQEILQIGIFANLFNRFPVGDSQAFLNNQRAKTHTGRFSRTAIFFAKKHAIRLFNALPGNLLRQNNPTVFTIKFTAKISVSLINGFGYVDRINWESYNESGDLTLQIKKYFRRFGCYPVAVLADKIYRTRENRNYCKERGIRLSGPPLGRPKKTTQANAAELKKEKQIHYQDERDRNAIEGKFGQGKRRFTLGLIMAKLAQTSEAVISISFIVMNLEKILSILFCFLAYHYQTDCQAQNGNAPEARNRCLPLQIAA